MWLVILEFLKVFFYLLLIFVWFFENYILLMFWWFFFLLFFLFLVNDLVFFRWGWGLIDILDLMLFFVGCVEVLVLLECCDCVEWECLWYGFGFVGMFNVGCCFLLFWFCLFWWVGVVVNFCLYFLWRLWRLLDIGWWWCCFLLFLFWYIKFCWNLVWCLLIFMVWWIIFVEVCVV